MEPALSFGDGESLFLQYRELIRDTTYHVCHRHHVSADDADDFASHVNIKFLERDYEILRQYEGRCQPKRYFSVVITRLLLDYRDAAWGRWRTSAEARRIGPLAMEFERLVVRDGVPFEEACESMLAKHPSEVTRRDLEQWAGRFPARSRRRTEGEDALANMPAEGTAADRFIDDRERRRKDDRLWALVNGYLESLEITDRLILVMRLKDGRSVAEIARTLRLQQRNLYPRLDRLLTPLRRALKDNGLGDGYWAAG